MSQLIVLYLQYLSLFLSLGAPPDDAKLAAKTEVVACVVSTMVIVDDGYTVDDSYVDIYAKPNCEAVPGPKVPYAGGAVVCNQRKCNCRMVPDPDHHGKYIKKCDPPEIDPATCTPRDLDTLHP